MDKIYKKISLEDFKNRFNGFRVQEEESTWGEVGNDYVVRHGNLLREIENKIPLVKGMTRNGADSVVIDGTYRTMRFGTLVTIHTWLIEIFNNSEFYYLCLRNGEKRWVQSTDSSIDILSTEVLGDNVDNTNIRDIVDLLPSIDAHSIGEAVWLTGKAEELKARFCNDNDSSIISGLKRIKSFILYFNSKKNNIPLASDVRLPYIEMNVMLTTDVNEMGEFTAVSSTADTVTSQTDSAITTESRLIELRRRKLDYDDDGNELPFVLGETDYGLGRIEEGGNVAYVNPKYLKDIIYNKSVGENGDTWGDVITDISVNGDKIKFSYIMGAKIVNDSYEGGISFEEEYYLGEPQNFDFTYDGKALTAINFREILYNQQPENYKPEDYDPEKSYATVTFTPAMEIGKSTYIKEEYLMGMIETPKSTEIPRVERGTSAAFEIHNILGECRTMEDLEKYRNDFFTIKDDEKQ